MTQAQDSAMMEAAEWREGARTGWRDYRGEVPGWVWLFLERWPTARDMVGVEARAPRDPAKEQNREKEA